MNLRIIETERTVLVVFAHPDDDALSCLGTLARLCDEHYQVYVLVLTAGECSITNCSVRLMEAEEVAQLVGYTLLKENLPDGNLHYDREIVSLIERHIHRLSPQMVITHYPQELGQGHQDHVVTASAVVNAARRNRCVDWILYAEPPTQNWIFVPNLFIDITEYLDIKKKCHPTASIRENETIYASRDRRDTSTLVGHSGIHRRGKLPAILRTLCDCQGLVSAQPLDGVSAPFA